MPRALSTFFLRFGGMAIASARIPRFANPVTIAPGGGTFGV
jgi:hypothetical protein